MKDLLIFLTPTTIVTWTTPLVLTRFLLFILFVLLLVAFYFRRLDISYIALGLLFFVTYCYAAFIGGYSLVLVYTGIWTLLSAYLAYNERKSRQNKTTTASD